MRNKSDTRRKRTPALPVSFFSSFTAVGFKPQSMLGISSKALMLDLSFTANMLGVTPSLHFGMGHTPEKMNGKTGKPVVQNQLWLNLSHEKEKSRPPW